MIVKIGKVLSGNGRQHRPSNTCRGQLYARAYIPASTKKITEAVRLLQWSIT